MTKRKTLFGARDNMEKVRLKMEVSSDLVKWIDELAEREGVTRTEIFRRALSVMKAATEQAAIGRKHIGFTSDPSRLEAEIVGILNH